MIAKLSMICSKQDNGAYFAICPEIKGCFTQGDTYEEAAANLKELVEITVKEELTEESEANQILQYEKESFLLKPKTWDDIEGIEPFADEIAAFEEYSAEKV